MSTNSISKGKSKLDKVNEYLLEIIKENANGEEEGDEGIDQDDIETGRGEQEVTETISTPKKKSKRRRPKRNKGKAKDTGCEADEENTEYEEVEDEFQLPDQFPFKESIATMPEEQQRAKLQELQEFMEKLRDKAGRDEHRVKMRMVMEFMKDTDVQNEAAQIGT
jgi:hypothetical protein